MSNKPHWEGGSGGKGSGARRMDISQEEYDNRWDAIFSRDLPKENKPKSDYQDILSTEDCVVDALDNLAESMR